MEAAEPGRGGGAPRGLWWSSGEALAHRGEAVGGGGGEDEDKSAAAGKEEEDQAGECEDQVGREVEDDCCTLD